MLITIRIDANQVPLPKDSDITDENINTILGGNAEEKTLTKSKKCDSPEDEEHPELLNEVAGIVVGDPPAPQTGTERVLFYFNLLYAL